MNATTRNMLLVICVATLGYGLWSFFVASRYQALCQLSYWSATETQLRACDDMQAELPRN
jgi:hypothetical protein